MSATQQSVESSPNPILGASAPTAASIPVPDLIEIDFPSKFARATACMRSACAQHGLDEDHLLAMLSDRPELRRAVEYTFGEPGSTPKRSEMQQLVTSVEDALDLADPLPVHLASPVKIALRCARALNAGAILLLSIWIVIGAIVTGHNEMAQNTSPTIALTMLVFALIGLGLLEAAHIGAVALSTADVSTLKASHPRVFRLHRFINTKHKLEEYLSARQLGVVMIVFIIAEVTRTADLEELPGTSIATLARWSRSCVSVSPARCWCWSSLRSRLS